MAAFVVSREGRHYSKVDRIKLMQKDSTNLFKIIQDEDDLPNTFKLFGPYEERQPEKHPSCSYIEIFRAEAQYYYQQKTSVHYLVMLLEHYFRFEPHWQRDNIVENIQNRAYTFIKMMQEAKPSEVVTKYYAIEDSAKELFNIELDCDISFSSVYSSLKKGERSFTLC